jgi:hypothetical protein
VVPVLSNAIDGGPHGHGHGHGVSPSSGSAAATNLRVHPSTKTAKIKRFMMFSFESYVKMTFQTTSKAMGKPYRAI